MNLYSKEKRGLGILDTLNVKPCRFPYLDVLRRTLKIVWFEKVDRFGDVPDRWDPYPSSHDSNYSLYFDSVY